MDIVPWTFDYEHEHEHEKKTAMTHPWILQQLDDAAALLARVRGDGALIEAIGRICDAVLTCLRAGGKILAFGNGGSATDALHLTEELIGRYLGDRPPLPALCLSVDGPALTCIGNDYGFERLFARQVEALCRPGDVAIAFSTSGNSANVNEALKVAREKGGVTVGILGRDGGAALQYCDFAAVVPHGETARIQEVHTVILHFICEAVEREYK